MAVPQHVVATTSWEAGGDITKYAGCVTNSEGTVVVGANDNDTGFVGVALDAAASGYAVALAGIGSIVHMVVGASGISAGDWVMLHGASGRVTKCGTTSGSAYSVVGRALEDGDTAGDYIAVLIAPNVNEV